MGIFETHAHYDDEVFDKDRESLLASMRENGVTRIMNVAADMASCKTTEALAERYTFIYGALGVHPSETGALTEEDMLWIREHAVSEKIRAIGEIGLDYHWKEPAKEVQKRWFRRQLALAAQLDMPVIIHSRDAAADTLSILMEENAAKLTGVVHCFSYAKEVAEAYMALGFYFGIGGVLTFSNARKLKEAVAEVIALKRIVLETDSPYLSPEPYRGTRNDSTRLPYVVKALAQLKGVSEEEVIRVTEENAEKLYRL